METGKGDIDTLKDLLENAVGKDCGKKAGAVFSSGIDSALVTFLASKVCDVTAYSVGTKGSEDLKYVRKGEKTLGFSTKIIEIDEDAVEEILPDLIRIIGTCEPLKVSVGVPLYFASRDAAKDGMKIMLSGQGGDELFGGYNRYLALAARDGKALEEAMEKDVKNAYIDNLDRDIAISRAFGLELRFPYMDEAFGRYAMQIPVEKKVFEVKGEEEFACVDEVEGRRFIRKYILRCIAAKVGLPKYILDRKKKAAQYGSESEKLIDRIAKKNGFRQKAADAGRKDYVRMYLESLA